MNRPAKKSKTRSDLECSDAATAATAATAAATATAASRIGDVPVSTTRGGGDTDGKKKTYQEEKQKLMQAKLRLSKKNHSQRLEMAKAKLANARMFVEKKEEDEEEGTGVRTERGGPITDTKPVNPNTDVALNDEHPKHPTPMVSRNGADGTTNGSGKGKGNVAARYYYTKGQFREQLQEQRRNQLKQMRLDRRHATTYPSHLDVEDRVDSSDEDKSTDNETPLDDAHLLSEKQHQKFVEEKDDDSANNNERMKDVTTTTQATISRNDLLQRRKDAMRKKAELVRQNFIVKHEKLLQQQSVEINTTTASLQKAQAALSNNQRDAQLNRQTHRELTVRLQALDILIREYESALLAARRALHEKNVVQCGSERENR